MLLSILTPVLALACWTLVMWVWMYATRLPAMREAGIDAAKMREKSEMDALPLRVRRIADNYNHLHEQPVLFYALAIYSHLVGVADPLNAGLAWAYVMLRVAHSVFQATINYVPARFVLFALASVCLFVIAGRNVWALTA